MRVLLIQPPYERLQGFNVCYFALNLGQLATSLEEAGHYSRVYNADINARDHRSRLEMTAFTRATAQEHYEAAFYNDDHYVWQEVRRTIDEFKPDMVGITCMTATYPASLKCAAIAKELDSNVRVVFGGPQPNAQPQDVALREQVDYVIQGEGEYPLVELCDQLDREGEPDLTGVVGLHYINDNGETVQTARNTFIPDLDALPMIRRDLVLYPEKYTTDAYGYVMGSRGCPFPCTFCSSPAIWNRETRYHSAESVVREWEYLREEFDVQRLRFWDDTYTLQRDRVVDFCDRLIATGSKFSWSCFVHANTVHKATLEKMKEAGCYELCVGIESGSDRILKEYRKGITTERVRKAVDLMNEVGFLVGSFWIVGMPQEREEDIRMTIDFIEELKVDRVNLCTFAPEPNTVLYDLCMEKGLLEKEVDWGTRLDVGHHNETTKFAYEIPEEVYRPLVREALEAATAKNQTTFRRRVKAFWFQKRYFLQLRTLRARLREGRIPFFERLFRFTAHLPQSDKWHWRVEGEPKCPD